MIMINATQEEEKGRGAGREVCSLIAWLLPEHMR